MTFTSELGMMIAMGVYLTGMLAIGFWVSRRTSTVSDFYLGGRKLGPFVTAMSAEASDMSSWLLMGLPGLAYLTGIAEAGWTALGLMAGTYLNWLLVARRLRRYSAATHSITVPVFFSNRYGDKRGILMLIAAVEIIIFFIPYTASGFAACGKLFASLFGVDYHAAMIISAVVIVAYTITGGFLAASTTDFIQSIVMTFALLIILLFGIDKAGGLDQVFANARELTGFFSMTQVHDPVLGGASSYGLIAIVSTVAWGLGYFGMPHILLRFMAIENDEKLTLSRRVATIWVILSMGVAVLIGIVGISVSDRGLIPVLEGSASETIIVQLASLLSTHGIGVALIAGIVLSGILASTMSTSDSQLLAASSSMSEDIIKGFFGIRLKEKYLMLIARASLLAIACIGVVMAWDQNSSVFVIVSFAWAGFGASFGPTMLLALFWRRSNLQGALAGMTAGGVMVFVWKFIVRPMGGAWNVYELLPAFIVAIAVNIVVSLVTAPPDKETTDVFDSI